MMIEALWAFWLSYSIKYPVHPAQSYYPVESSCASLQRFYGILFIQVTKNRAKMVIALFNLLEFVIYFDYKKN